MTPKTMHDKIYKVGFKNFIFRLFFKKVVQSQKLQACLSIAIAN